MSSASSKPAPLSPRAREARRVALRRPSPPPSSVLFRPIQRRNGSPVLDMLPLRRIELPLLGGFSFASAAAVAIRHRRSSSGESKPLARLLSRPSSLRCLSLAKTSACRETRAVHLAASSSSSPPAWQPRSATSAPGRTGQRPVTASSVPSFVRWSTESPSGSRALHLLVHPCSSRERPQTSPLACAHPP